MFQKKSYKVLLIEDDEEDYMLTRDLLSDVKDQKYLLDWASDYTKGIEEIRKTSHDIYLIDFRLGKNTGLELVQQVVSEGFHVPMILLTGQRDQIIDENAMELGVADYLVKGTFDPAALDRSIRYSISQFKALEEVRRLHENSEKRVVERTLELASTIEKLELTNKSLLKNIEERKLADEALRTSQKLLLAIATNYPGGMIAVLDSEWRYIFLEGKILSELGINKEELLGKKFTATLKAEQINLVTPPIISAFSGKTAEFEISLLHKVFICHTVPLPDSRGNIRQIMLVSQNITERKKAEEEIKKSLEKEKMLNEMKSRFVSMASHEFRTPLATILSSASLVSRYNEVDDFEKRLKHINRIRNSVKNLTEILNEFLSFDKLNQGLVSTAQEYIDLKTFIEEIIEEMNVQTKPGQKINLTFKTDPAHISFDATILRNILLNLISNAIKYSNEDQPIEIDVTLNDNELIIDITDHGIGIPQEDQKHIFKTFYRATNVVTIQGTGLGLNIVKKYIETLKGKIKFESVPSKGTTFSINIPVNNK